MQLLTEQPIQPTRIEPKPEVAAFYDPDVRFTEICAGWLSVFAILYFVGQFIRAALNGWL
jgi:hypothetical protein